MRLLLDQDVFASTNKFLVELSYHVTRVAELGMATASDESILIRANASDSILITRDRDYGHLVFVRQMGVGVIYLRMRPSTIDLVHVELARVLNRYSADQLRAGFVVINEHGHRFRSLG